MIINRPLIILFFLILSNSYSQRSNVFNEKTKKETETYYNNATKNYPKNIDSAIFYALKTSKLAQKIGYDSLSLNSIKILSGSFLYLKDYKKATYYATKLDSLAHVKNNIKFRLEAFRILAGCQFYGGKYDKAIGLLLKASDFALALKDTVSIAKIYTNISTVYIESNQSKFAESFAIKALNLLKISAIDNIETRNNQADLYAHLVSLQCNLKNKEQAFLYLNNLIDFCNKHKDLRAERLISFKEGKFHETFGDYENAMVSYEKAYNELEKIKDTVIMSVAANDVVNAALKIKNYQKAAYYFEKLTLFINNNPKVADRFTKVPSTYLLYYENGLNLYKNTGDLKKAFEYSQKINESLAVINKNKIDSVFVAYGTKFNAVENENKIAQQKLEISEAKIEKSAAINFMVLFVLVIFIILSIIYVKMKNKRIKMASELKQEKEFTRFRTRFLETVSHEIRTPITLLNGYLNRIKEQKDISEKTDEYATQAIESAKKVLANANKVLELSKFEKDHLRLNKTQFLLNKFVSELFFSFKNKAQEEQQSLIYKSNITDNLMVNFDCEKLETILNNVIFNALKYSYKNAQIRLETNLSEDRLVFKVTDEGIGIAPKDLKNIFKRFYQTEDNKTLGGMGIGLSIVKEFTTFLEGTVSVKSTLGGGSEFTLTFLLSVDNLNEHLSNTVVEFTPEVIVSEIPKKEISTSKVRILIVEDNKSMSRYLSEVLTPHYNFDIAYNGHEALENAKQTRYDLILSDLMMPEMDGLEFKEALNKLSDYENIPFIILSASTLSENKIKGFNIGINDYLTKPFNVRELIARINNLLANKATQLEAFKIADESDIEVDYSNSFNAKLINKITAIIHKNIENDEFKVDDLALKCGYSQRQLSRMLIKITGMNPVKFILEIRLLKAYELLLNKTCPTIKEVKYCVGINSSPYFNAKFTERFGISPSELLKAS